MHSLIGLCARLALPVMTIQLTASSLEVSGAVLILYETFSLQSGFQPGHSCVEKVAAPVQPASCSLLWGPVKSRCRRTCTCSSSPRARMAACSARSSSKPCRRLQSPPSSAFQRCAEPPAQPGLSQAELLIITPSGVAARLPASQPCQHIAASSVSSWHLPARALPQRLHLYTASYTTPLLFGRYGRQLQLCE